MLASTILRNRLGFVQYYLAIFSFFMVFLIIFMIFFSKSQHFCIKFSRFRRRFLIYFRIFCYFINKSLLNNSLCVKFFLPESNIFHENIVYIAPSFYGTAKSSHCLNAMITCFRVFIPITCPHCRYYTERCLYH